MLFAEGAFSLSGISSFLRMGCCILYKDEFTKYRFLQQQTTEENDADNSLI